MLSKFNNEKRRLKRIACKKIIIKSLVPLSMKITLHKLHVHEKLHLSYEEKTTGYITQCKC